MNSVINKYCTTEWQDFIGFHSTTFKYSKNDVILEFGADVEGLFFVNTGKVKITTPTPTGDRIIRLASDGDIVGHRGLGGTWKYTISAIALEETDVLFVPMAILTQVLKANPDFAFFILMFFADELRDSEKLAYQSSVKNLIALALLKNYEAFGFEADSTKLGFSLQRKDLASMAGTTYESTIRSLSELQKDGIIKLEGKSILILSLRRLKRLAG
jgi:CRP-like cAMP-binding protein